MTTNIVKDKAAAPTEKELCAALSDLFVVGRANYPRIARVANHFPPTRVEEVLLDWVGPVLYKQFYSTIPDIWRCNEEWLWNAVQRNLKKNQSANPIRLIFRKLRRKFIRWTLGDEWKMLKPLLMPVAPTPFPAV